MIKDERVSKIVNEILEKEMNKTKEEYLKFEKFTITTTGRTLDTDCRNILLLSPMYLLEYIDNVEKSTTYNEEEKEIIHNTQKQLERWISVYESENIVEECYEYLRQEKEKINNRFKEKTKKIGNEESILKASAKIGGVALRNLQRKNNNLEGKIEEYNYDIDLLSMICEYDEIVKKQELIEEYLEQNYIEENENNEEEEM